MPSSICVYAASSGDAAPAYLDTARRFGALMAERGHTLVYGAGSLGLMGELARAVHAAGGRVVGVIPEKLRAAEQAYEDADELIITNGMGERKAIMAARADAFVALPGGLGTLDEIVDILVHKQLEYHRKPLVLVNTNGIYDRFLGLLDALVAARFVQERHRGLLTAVSQPEEVFQHLTQPSAREG